MVKMISFASNQKIKQRNISWMWIMANCIEQTKSQFSKNKRHECKRYKKFESNYQANNPNSYPNLYPVMMTENQHGIFIKITTIFCWNMWNIPRSREHPPNSYMDWTMWIFFCVTMCVMHPVASNPTNRGANNSNHEHKQAHCFK